MKKIKILLDKLILTKIDKINPRLYRFLTYDIYRKIYSPFINRIKYKDKYFFHSVGIETSTYCNRKCDYCPNKDNETPKNYIDIKIFEESIRQLKKIKFTGIFEYCLYNEPLFDPNLSNLIRYAKKELPKCMHVLTSNGDLLTIEKAKELIDAGIDKFIVTIHDKNPERAYERLSKVKDVIKDKMRLQTTHELALQNRGGMLIYLNINMKSLRVVLIY